MRGELRVILSLVVCGAGGGGGKASGGAGGGALSGSGGGASSGSGGGAPGDPPRAGLASPDAAADAPLDVSYADGQVTVTLPNLVAYDIIVLNY